MYGPQKQMMISVIEHALLDLVSRDPALRSDARAFITRPDCRFELFCYFLGLDAEAVRDRLSLGGA